MTTNLFISVAPRPESKSQQLAKLLPGIEAALTERHRHEVIHEHIKNTVGLELTYQYYKTTLTRIRKKREQAKVTTVVRPSLRPAANLAAATGQQTVNALATDQSGPRFTYDVKAPIDNFF
jgi:hypothetical protein